MWISIFALISYPLVAVSLTQETVQEDTTANIDFKTVSVKVIYEHVDHIEKDISNGKKYEDLVVKYSKQYGVSYTLMNAIMTCENVNREPTKQSDLRYNFTNERLGIIKGEREYSFGLVQINLHYNPNITYEQATDPEFSIELLAKWISQGNVIRWGSYTDGCYLKHM